MTKARTKEPGYADSPEQIPEGKYKAICYDFDIKPYLGGDRKAYLKFRIYESEFEGTELFMACSYPKGTKSFGLKINTEWQIAMGRRRKRGERIALKDFVKRMYLVKVRDAKRVFNDGSPMPDFMSYSVVDRIVEPVTGGMRQ